MTTAASTSTWTTPAKVIALEWELEARGADAGTVVRAIRDLVDDAIDNAVAQLRAEVDEAIVGKVDVDDAVGAGAELEQRLDAIDERISAVQLHHVTSWHTTPTTSGLL